MIKKISLFIATAISTIAHQNALSANELNVYSARKEALIKPVLDKFSASTGIEVRLITGKADALLTRLRLEGKASPADVFITVDAGRLHRAKQANILQAISSNILEQKIPQNLRDVDGFWYGLSQRARPIFYAADRVKPEELSSYENLADKKWQGRICMRSSNSIYNQSLVASMFDANGEEKTLTWLTTFVENFKRKPVGGDTDQLKAVAAGQCDITIANTYYFGRLINSQETSDKEVASKLRIFWPNQADRGTHVNVSGAGVTKHAKNKDNAIQLIEFLASAESQAWYSSVNNEYPVVKDAKISNTLSSWGKFKQDTVDLTILGENNLTAIQLMDRAGWR